MHDDSISQWLQQLQTGEEEAARQLWNRYFQQLVTAARRRLATFPRRISDEEDVALSAFHSFCRRAAEGRFPDLHDRHDLWNLLFTITERKAMRSIEHQRRQRRGGGAVRGMSALGSPQDQDGGPQWEAVPLHPGQVEPTPEFAAEIADQVSFLLNQLPDDTLREVAILKMEGWTVDEVAAKVGISSRSVKRKLQLIRTLWSDEEAS